MRPEGGALFAEGRDPVLFTLVRHAHAGDRKTWPFSESDRPLSEQGRQQAQGLTQSLGAQPARLILSSPYRRCQQTLSPLAALTGLSIQTSGLLAPEAKPAALDALLQDPALDGAVLCTHGEVLVALLRRWDRHGRVTVPLPRRKLTKDATAKCAAWVVEGDGGSLTAHYLRPVRILDFDRECNPPRVIAS